MPANLENSAVATGLEKERNSKDLREAEEIKNGGKNTQNYTKKVLKNWITMMVWSFP